MHDMDVDDDGIIWDIEEEHLDEAEFLFSTRESLLESADYTLDELAEGPDRRLLAHVDALAVGGRAVAERLLLPTIEDAGAEPSMIAAATLALFIEADEHACARALAALERVSLESRDAIVRGLQLSERAGLDAWLIQGLQASCTNAAARIQALAGRRAPVGPWLLAFLDHEDLESMKAAAILARQNHAGALLGRLLGQRDYDDPDIGQSLLEAGLCHHVADAWEITTRRAFAPGPSAARREALTSTAQLGDARIHHRLLDLLDDPARRHDCLWALGFGGRPAAVDRAVELLGDEDHGALAAEVVCAIAGLSTDASEHWRAGPGSTVESDPPFEDEDLDASLVPSAEANLPIPEPDAIEAWWHRHRSNFDPSLRYLGGRLLSGPSLLAALGSVPMRRRLPLAFELEVRSAGTTSVNVHALAPTQRREIAQLPLPTNLGFQRGFAPSHQVQHR